MGIPSHSRSLILRIQTDLPREEDQGDLEVLILELQAKPLYLATITLLYRMEMTHMRITEEEIPMKKMIFPLKTLVIFHLNSLNLMSLRTKMKRMKILMTIICHIGSALVCEQEMVLEGLAIGTVLQKE